MRREFKPLSADDSVMSAAYAADGDRKRGYDAVECHMEGSFRITKFKTPWTCDGIPVFATTSFDTKRKVDPSKIMLTAEDGKSVINITEPVKRGTEVIHGYNDAILSWEDINLRMANIDFHARNMPYVQTRKEFYDFNSPYYQALMDTRDYQCYLKWVKREIDCGYGDCFIGKVRDAESFAELYAENSFEQPVEDFDTRPTPGE